MLLVCLFAHAAREYVESFEGCEGLADRLALQAETGQDQVCVLTLSAPWGSPLTSKIVWH